MNFDEVWSSIALRIEKWLDHPPGRSAAAASWRRHLSNDYLRVRSVVYLCSYTTRENGVCLHDWLK